MKKWEAVLIALNLRDLPLVGDDTDYPPFKVVMPCPKCKSSGTCDGNSGHSAVFFKACTEVVGILRVSRPERMRRHCRTCGAYWWQLPADTAGAAD